MIPWPVHAHNPNGITIGSAVFAGLSSVTDRRTDHATQSVTVGHIYVRSAAMHLIITNRLNVTDNGRVLKAINRGRRAEIEPHVIEVISVFADGSPVTGLRVRRHPSDRHRSRLIVMSRDEIRSIPLHRCHKYVTCRYQLFLLQFRPCSI